MEEIIFIIGVVIFLFILFYLFKKVFKKKKQFFFAIKEVTKCKDDNCVTEYQIQGISDKSFRTLKDAKRYALFLKNAK